MLTKAPDESAHERFSGELPVRLGRERLGLIDLGEVFSRHLDQWENGTWSCQSARSASHDSLTLMPLAHRATHHNSCPDVN